MSGSYGRVTRILGFLAVFLVVSASQAFREDAYPLSPEHVLREAFERRYGCDLSAHVEIHVISDSGERLERKLDLASKYIDGRLHSLARFSEPPYLRGTGLLIIERADLRSADEQFIFLPSLKRVRRISGAQRGDAFLGTDLTFEDFERHRVDDFELAPLTVSTTAGESVYVIEATPRILSSRTRVKFFAARSDFAILRIEDFKNSVHPFKILEVPRSGIHTEGMFRVPSVMTVHHPERGTRTTVRIERLVLNPVLAEGLFSSMALESGRSIPIHDEEHER
ncbi:MAG: outer membrane lipoprotein-sorting protein [bacterium]|nr:outer membrane lipoprotein-sorting protein [bacterium]MCP5066308.1 outer membrane lipoprotein-sorting protein [bacterium]